MIDSTEFGEIKVKGKTYAFDIYIFWDGEIRQARTSVRHLFSKQELSFLLKKNPEVIIVGTGQYGSLEVSEDVEKVAGENGVEFLKLVTPEAIGEFNSLAEAGKKVAAYMHVTC